MQAPSTGLFCERVEIGRALEAELGQRTDLQRPENFPKVNKGDTRDLAAKAAGFGNGKLRAWRALITLGAIFGLSSCWPCCDGPTLARV